MTPARLIAISLLIVSAIAIIAVSNGLLRSAPEIDREELLMGSIVRIKAPISVKGGAVAVARAIDKTFREIARIERVFSIYRADSEISRINRLKSGESLRISKEAFDLIRRSVEFSRMTGGAFDITVKPLTDIWARAKADGAIPSQDEINSAMENVGSKHIKLDEANRTIAFDRGGMSVDMNAIVQGYACDRAIRILKENGVTAALVDTSGEIYCLGRRSDGKGWKVGIQHPRNRGQILFELELHDKAIVTSGDYEKFFMLDGRRYSHVIDPRTGYPVGDTVVSASVIADEATSADALATALCVLGRDGLKCVDALAGQDAVIVCRENGALKVDMTEGLKRRYSVKEKSKI